MAIIGWIREADKAACGGLVIEGDRSCNSNGRPHAFEGAQLACKKTCSIAEGYPGRRLMNGCSSVIHGMKTSGGCPLLSTLNDQDGVSSGGIVPSSFFLNTNGIWTGVAVDANEHRYDEQAQLSHQHTQGIPYHIETMDGRSLSGRIGPDGRLPRVNTFGEDEYTVLWGDEALARMNGRS